jgi:hypothetical protein
VLSHGSCQKGEWSWNGYRAWGMLGYRGGMRDRDGWKRIKVGEQTRIYVRSRDLVPTRGSIELIMYVHSDSNKQNPNWAKTVQTGPWCRQHTTSIELSEKDITHRRENGVSEVLNNKCNTFYASTIPLTSLTTSMSLRYHTVVVMSNPT